MYGLSSTGEIQLVERYRVVHMQIFVPIEFSTVYIRALEAGNRGVSKLFKVRFYFTEVPTYLSGSSPPPPIDCLHL